MYNALERERMYQDRAESHELGGEKKSKTAFRVLPRRFTPEKRAGRMLPPSKDFLYSLRPFQSDRFSRRSKFHFWRDVRFFTMNDQPFFPPRPLALDKRKFGHT